jgi:hypothetical protein
MSGETGRAVGKRVVKERVKRPSDSLAVFLRSPNNVGFLVRVNLPTRERLLWRALGASLSFAKVGAAWVFGAAWESVSHLVFKVKPV